MKKPTALSAFKDNTIWLVHVDARASVVGPGDAASALSALSALNEKGFELNDILVTLHVADHTGGTAAPRARHHGAVWRPALCANERTL